MKLIQIITVAILWGISQSLLYGQSGENLFNDEFLHEVRLTSVDTNIFIGSKEYQLANMEIDGTQIDSIGFRKKGNLSASHGNNKFPFKIKSNKYVNGKKYDGIKEFTLHNNFQDPSMMREKMTYDLLGELGLHSLRTSYTRLYINGKYWGLYTLVEAKDELYKRAFDNNDGAVLESTDFGDMCYLGLNQEDYFSSLFENYIYTIDNGNETTAWENFPNMLDVANNISTFEYMNIVPNYINVEHFFKYQAANVYLLNFDSYIGFRGNQLYYFDEVNEKWEIIPWDFNASFGLWNSNNYRPFDYPALPSAVKNGCIGSKINDVPELENIYFETMCELTNNLADTTHMVNVIEKWREQIKQAVYEDWRKEFPNSQFEDGVGYGYFDHAWEEFVPGMKTFVIDRWEYITEQLNNIEQNCMATSTDELVKKMNFSVYPNPVSDIMYIQSSIPIHNSQINLIDINGRNIMTNLNIQEGINTSSLIPGMYFISIENETGRQMMKFFKT